MIKNNSFSVLPLDSIITNKTQASNGERVTITANFTEPVQNNFTIDLSGAINNKGIILKELSPYSSIEDIEKSTEATLIIDEDLKVMEV